MKSEQHWRQGGISQLEGTAVIVGTWMRGSQWAVELGVEEKVTWDCRKQLKDLIALSIVAEIKLRVQMLFANEIIQRI